MKPGYEYLLNQVYLKMIDYYAGDPTRIQHFVKVHSFSKLIGQQEKLDEHTQFILEATAYVHDIGIKPAEAQYGREDGPLQERLGPPVAEPMLKEIGFEDSDVERICYLIGHHHTYTDMDGLDYQILVEADFLVNLFENHSAKDHCQSCYERIFKTETGKHICKTMFQLS